MTERRQWSLLIGGLLHAADMPGLESQVVPTAADLEIAARAILGAPVRITGGQPDSSIQLGFGGDSNLDTSRPRRYSVEVPADVEVADLVRAFKQALEDVTPLPLGIVSSWTLVAGLEDNHGTRVSSWLVEVPRYGGRRSLLLRRNTLSGAVGGGLIGAGFGPPGAAGGMILGGAAGYLIERRLQKLNRARSA